MRRGLWNPSPKGGSKLSQNKEQTQGKEIVIDGPNIALSHSNNKWPGSARGVEIAIHHYTSLGWTVRSIVPRHFLSPKGKRGVDNPAILERLVEEGIVSTVPSQDHDDHYWLAYALQTGAYVVTNDRMKDHAGMHSDGEEAFFKWRQNMVISYAFVGDTFIPNPDFKLPAPPAKESVKPVEKSQPKSSTKPKKQQPSKQAKPTKPAKQSKKTKQDSANDFSDQVKAEIRVILGNNQVKLHTISQHLMKNIKRNNGKKYTNIKAMMADLKLPKTRPFHFQLSRLMGDEIEIIKKGQRADSVKLKPSAKKTKSDVHKKKTKPMTMAFFKQALGEGNEELLSQPVNTFPHYVQKGFKTLCSMDFPINVAKVGNRFKNASGIRLSSVFNKMDKLAFFLSIRPECACGEVYYDGSLFHCRKDGESTKKSDLSNFENGSKTKVSGLRRLLKRIFGL